MHTVNQKLYNHVANSISDSSGGIKKEALGFVSFADARIRAPNPFALQASIFDNILEWLKNASKITICGEEETKTILDTTRKLFNDYVRPIDIPWLPNLVIEPRVDDLLENSLVALVSQAIDGICDNYITPTNPPTGA